MLNRQLIDLIGFITKDGVHAMGATAVLCYTHATVNDLNQSLDFARSRDT